MRAWACTVLFEFDLVTVYANGKLDLPCLGDDPDPGERQLSHKGVDKGDPERVLDYFGIFTGKDTGYCRNHSSWGFATPFLPITVGTLVSLPPSRER